jgi:hypothetical protein
VTSVVCIAAKNLALRAGVVDKNGSNGPVRVDDKYLDVLPASEDKVGGREASGWHNVGHGYFS